MTDAVQLLGIVPKIGTDSVASSSELVLMQSMVNAELPAQEVTLQAILDATGSTLDTRIASSSTTTSDSGSTSTAGFNSIAVLTGMPTAGSTLLQAINGEATVTVTLSAATATANFEVSSDNGVTFAAISMRQRNSNYTTNSSTGIGLFDGECAGKTHFRIRQTGAGGLTAAITFSALTNTVQLLNPIRLFDNTSGAQASIKLASTAPLATDTALVAALSPNGNSVTGSGIKVTVIPAVTASSYTAGYVMGGIETFANALPSSFLGILQSLTLTFKGSAQTTEMDVAIFSASPSGTFADHGAPAIASGDSALLLGIYQLTNPLSLLGTHTVYALDGIGKQLQGSSTSLYAVVTSRSATAANLASTSDMALSMGLIW